MGPHSKGLPHEVAGTSTKNAAKHLWKAVQTNDAREFKHVPLGGYIKLANLQAAFAFDLCGPDAADITSREPEVLTLVAWGHTNKEIASVFP